MTRKKKRETPEWQWEQALIDDYCDYRYRQVFDSLYDKLSRWKVGELSHADIDNAIHQAHKQDQELYRLFTEDRDDLVKLIQWDEWFDEWVKNHPPPAGIELAPLALKPSTFSQEEQDDDTTF